MNCDEMKKLAHAMAERNKRNERKLENTVKLNREKKPNKTPSKRKKKYIKREKTKQRR